MIVGKDETIGGLLNEGGERGTLDCEAKTHRRLIVGKKFCQDVRRKGFFGEFGRVGEVLGSKVKQGALNLEIEDKHWKFGSERIGWKAWKGVVLRGQRSLTQRSLTRHKDRVSSTIKFDQKLDPNIWL